MDDPIFLLSKLPQDAGEKTRACQQPHSYTLTKKMVINDGVDGQGAVTNLMYFSVSGRTRHAFLYIRNADLYDIREKKKEKRKDCSSLEHSTKNCNFQSNTTTR